MHAADLERLLIFAANSRHHIRNKVIVLLSAKADLRAGEIANLTWDMVIDAAGDVGTIIELRDHAAKKKSGRIIPIHPDLRAALHAWRSRNPEEPGAVVRSERGTPTTL